MKIVQVGSNNGNDPLYRFLQPYKSEIETLILVEPFKIHLDDLRECYKDFESVIIENVAVKTKSMPEEELTIHYYEGDAPTYHVASIYPEHIYKHYGVVPLNSFTIPCVTIEEILNRNNLKEFDWLLIDVEGLDAELVLNFDWSSYKIKRVDVEHLHLGNDSSRVLDLFKNMGYNKIESTNAFDWAFELPGNTIHSHVE